MTKFHLHLLKAAALLLLLNVSLFAQIDESWLGIWRGKLEIRDYNPGLRDSILMELHISKTDSAGILNWRIIYSDSAKDDRKYLLRTADVSKGKYVIDEKDGIMLDTYLFGHKLISRFEVMKSLLEITYTLEGDKIIFQLTSGKAESTSVSESSTEDIEVRSYNITNSQNAVLYKVQ